MLPPHLEVAYPKLKADSAKVTSPRSIQYNCIAWSAHRDTLRWWEPNPREPWDYWPPGLPADYSFESFVLLFESLGYSRCLAAHLEIFYEKVALYADPLGFTHVASQLPTGGWTSKLGSYEDIQHNSLQSLEGVDGEEYGDVRQILKRPCNLGGVLVRVFWKLARR